MSFRVGDTVGDYVILEELGSGGMGQVFKVEHTITRRHEAIKVLAGTTPSARDSFMRFLREIRLQASLKHPNIAEVHNAFWTGEHLVMVMELLQGVPLERLLQQSRIPLEDGVGILRQVLNALAEAHTHGVVHRDVSPSNIFVTDDKQVKLTDFGLATMVADLRYTHNGAFLGSFHYMSPEQVRGTGPVDARSDIYSCGAVLYEIVTGRKAFNYDNAFSLMRAQVEQEPLPPESINPDLPHGLNDIVLLAMAKDPEQRFASAMAFRSALDTLDPFTLCLASAGVAEEPAANESANEDRVEAAHGISRHPAPAPVKGPRWRLAAGLILGVLLVLAAGFAALDWPDAETLEPRPPVVAVDPAPHSPAPLSEPAAAEPPPEPLTPVEPPVAILSPTPEPAPAARKSRVPAQPKSGAALPHPVIHNALPPEPPPAATVMPLPGPPRPAPSILENPPKIEAAGSTPLPTPGIALSGQAVPPPPPAEELKTEEKGGVRRFFGRFRSLNPLRRKPDEAPAAGGAKPSKP